ncbi:MAG: hypothetical protein LBS88_03710 [Tannerellaceae bacterium]|jgi:hypothetical protein|nr:hypothetical protein [Tannerellaceae bacterium]
MKSIKHFYLIAGLFVSPLWLEAQISNVQVAAEGEQIIITYDYAAQSESIDEVVVTYTTGDETEAKEATALTGDLHALTPGTGKTIVWSPLNETTNATFEAQNLVIHLTGVRDKVKQAECDNNIRLADRFFADKDYETAIIYYSNVINCPNCNCNPSDLAYAGEQVRLSERNIRLVASKDKVHVSYLFDMATAEGGNSMHGLSAFLLKNGGVGGYASFRSDKNFYSPRGNLSYFTDVEELQGDYQLTPLSDVRLSSWLFSTGLTTRLIQTEYASAYFYGGVGLGANSLTGNYLVGERGYEDERRLTDGVKNLFLSPEAGVIGNIYDYFSLMVGLKYPLSMTTNELIKTKGISLMLGVGVKLKSIPKDGYTRASTYVAYMMDVPGQAGGSTNIIGFSAGTISYHKVGAYFSARINPLLFSPKDEVVSLSEEATYAGVSDHANAIGTFGLTWMYFYGGLGVSYQKEYKLYNDAAGAELWASQRNNIGLCSEFGVNLRLFDRLLLRGGVTFPGFSISNKNSEFTMKSGHMFYSLGLGYVLPVK